MKTAWPTWPTAWAARPTAPRALEIMKDSRIGAFGAIALVLALGRRSSLLALLAAQGMLTWSWRLVWRMCCRALGRCS